MVQVAGSCSGSDGERSCFGRREGTGQKVYDRSDQSSICRTTRVPVPRILPGPSFGNAEYLVDILEPPRLRPIVRAEFTRDRKLDRGNANPGNLGEDFGRLGIKFWDEVKKLSPRNSARNRSLEMLNLWRNAIAHQHFDPDKLGSTSLGLAQVRNWRIACDRLARAFDKVMREHIRSVTGKTPWK